MSNPTVPAAASPINLAPVQTNPQLYIPKEAVNSSQIKHPIHLHLKGPPGSGKTTSALTFPNPFVIDFDNGLTAHQSKNIPCIKAYEWGEDSAHTNLLNFLKQEGPKFSSEQTLILDSLTRVVDIVNSYFTARIPLSKKTGEEDTFWFWDRYEETFVALGAAIVKLKCNVVVISHDIEVRDPKSGALKRIKGVLNCARLQSFDMFFTDAFHQCLMESSKDGLNSGDYAWQIRKDYIVDCKTRQFRKEMFVKAHYSSINY